VFAALESNEAALWVPSAEALWGAVLEARH
jgi:hypothetical protein